jgi:hypothetical protein
MVSANPCGGLGRLLEELIFVNPPPNLPKSFSGDLKKSLLLLFGANPDYVCLKLDETVL